MITFKLNNYVELPQELIDDAPLTGRFDEYAEYILSKYEVEASLRESQAYLKKLGAWQEYELADLETNKKRLLWSAILDCASGNTNMWYMGE